MASFFGSTTNLLEIAYLIAGRRKSEDRSKCDREVITMMYRIYSEKKLKKFNLLTKNYIDRRKKVMLGISRLPTSDL